MKNKKTIMFTAGKAAESLLTLNTLERIEYFVDNGANKEPQLFHGKKVHRPQKLLEENKDDIMIIVGNNFYYKEISEQLDHMGFIEDKHYFNGYFLSAEYHKANQKITWADREFYGIFENQSWEDRIKIMADLIDEDVESIMDLGCGGQKLKKYISNDIKYIGVDYKKRTEDTIVCDFNKEKIPDMKVDAYFLSGSLEYIDDLKIFINSLTNSKYIIASYNPRDYYSRFGSDRAPSWSSHLSFSELIANFFKNNYRLINIFNHSNTCMLFKFAKS